MDKELAMSKIKEMIIDDVIYLTKECNRLLNCGGIDVDSYEDNYILPKIILYTALTNLKEQRRPFDTEHIAEANNLLCF